MTSIVNSELESKPDPPCLEPYFKEVEAAMSIVERAMLERKVRCINSSMSFGALVMKRARDALDVAGSERLFRFVVTLRLRHEQGGIVRPRLGVALPARSLSQGARSPFPIERR